MKRQRLILSDGAPLARGDVLVCERQGCRSQASFGFVRPRPHYHVARTTSDVRFESLADMAMGPRDVRFTPHNRTCDQRHLQMDA